MASSGPPNSDASARQLPLFLLGAALAAALLALHARVYAFLTDDAYISFRYARNLVEGHGLVFNPGFEAVEGYSNFLWTLLLAGLHALGLPLEAAAGLGSVAASGALFATVAWFAWRTTPRERWPFALVPLFLLAATRSVAVWTTSGLETRFFEALVFGGVVRLLVEDARLRAGRAAGLPLGATLLALATLTRPEGPLFFGAVFGALLLLRWRALWARRGWIAASGAVYAALVGAHLAFRWATYGDLVPNTYYAKLGGRLWWTMGLQYAAVFVIEYGVLLWLPLLAAGVAAFVRRGEAAVPLLFAAATLPFGLYQLAIGGDHFEFRPFDLFFPFAYLLMGAGAAALAGGRRASLGVAAGLALVLVFLVELPWRSHVQFPARYYPGFPGIAANHSESPVYREALTYLLPERSPLYGLPGLRRIADVHRLLLRSNSAHFVGLRQEEHAAFLATVRPEGRELAALVAAGRLPADTHIAVDSVGALPFESRLRTLDRLGLTDRDVARGEFVQEKVLAHGKYADVALARKKGVDLWAIDPVHLLWDVDHPIFRKKLRELHEAGIDAWFAPVGGDRYLLAWLPLGAERTLPRFPKLAFESASDAAAVRRLLAAGAPGRAQEREESAARRAARAAKSPQRP